MGHYEPSLARRGNQRFRIRWRRLLRRIHSPQWL